MRALLRGRRPSPAMLVAIVALVAAVAGTAAALPGHNSVHSDDIKRGGVKLSDLHANSVNSAKVTPESINDSDIGDLSTFGALKVTATDGASATAAETAAPEQLLASAGPFSIYAKCFRDVPGDRTHAEIYARTSSDGSLLSSSFDNLDGRPSNGFLDAGTAETDRRIAAASEDTAFAGSFRSTYEIAAPDGTSLSGLATAFVKDGNLTGSEGAYGAGNICIFAGHVLS